MSATNDRRAEFQRMMEAGTAKPAEFDVVVVHSFSRFFRDHFELDFIIHTVNDYHPRFVDACKAAEALGFVHKGGSGSHRAFARSGEPMLLNFQNRDGGVPPYQARQLIAMIQKYGDDQ